MILIVANSRRAFNEWCKQGALFEGRRDPKKYRYMSAKHFNKGEYRDVHFDDYFIVDNTCKITQEALAQFVEWWSVASPEALKERVQNSISSAIELFSPRYLEEEDVLAVVGAGS